MTSKIIPLKELKNDTLTTLAHEIKKGLLCVIPTETVYGLAGNALLASSVEAIYKAKGRPSDNPLILHVSSLKMVHDIAKDIKEDALLLMETLWPGPLTFILNKKSHVPYNVTGGLETVAVRMPNIQEIRDLIEACGVPLAAPSANLSGKPSSTRFSHVLHDFKEKIPYLIDGGDSHLGLESTVLDCTVSPFQILRPGKLLASDIESVLGKKVRDGLKEETKKSPGVRYKHYQPQGKVYLINDLQSIKNPLEYDTVLIHTKEDDVSNVSLNKVLLGSQNNPSSMDQNLYAVLRDVDQEAIKTIYILVNKKMSGALLDRLKRASHQEGVTHD